MKRVFGVLTVSGLIISIQMIFFWSPVETSMGFVQKIMYIHVPSAWTAFMAFFIAFVFSLAYLWKRLETFDVIAFCSVEIGVVFCALTLITGSIWAKPTWNTYWTWDARLTTTLVLLLIYAGYLLLRRFSNVGEQQARFSAVVAIIGFMDIPLIHLSVVWWRTLHQPSTVFSAQKNVIALPILQTLIISLITFSVFFVFLLLNRINLEVNNREYLRELANIN